MVWLIRHLKPFHNPQGLIPSTFYPNVPIENKTNSPMTGSAHPGIGGEDWLHLKRGKLREILSQGAFRDFKSIGWFLVHRQ